MTVAAFLLAGWDGSAYSRLALIVGAVVCIATESDIYEKMISNIQEIRARDHADSTRAIAPLKRIAEQHYIDSSHLEREEVISAVLNYARRCLES